VPTRGVLPRVRGKPVHEPSSVILVPAVAAAPGPDGLHLGRGHPAGVIESPVPCPANPGWNGFYELLRYSGLAALGIVVVSFASAQSP
jgi:hypothetical protein